ncbi:MAG TPA: GldG family protein, partial [Verrucomicrobiae bacterium]|nr:GldG family protein [Verrucomicrobiae bacterium]
MNQKRTETLIYSTVGVVAMLLIVIALNFIFSLTNARIDLTAEKLYTLSDGTKEILRELDTEIEVRLYATQDEKVMPVPLKTYARRVESLLREYAQHANGNLVIRKLDPEPDSDAEDSARLDGIEGQPVNLGEQIYLGVAFSMLDRTAALSFLTPNREQLLEYDLTRAISQVVKTEKPVVGVMSSLPVMGMPMNPMMMRMGQQGQQPWVLISELQRDFEVREIPMSGEAIPGDIDVLFV